MMQVYRVRAKVNITSIPEVDRENQAVKAQAGRSRSHNEYRRELSTQRRMGRSCASAKSLSDSRSEYWRKTRSVAVAFKLCWFTNLVRILNVDKFARCKRYGLRIRQLESMGLGAFIVRLVAA